MFRTRWTTVLACLIAPAVVTWVVSDLSLRHHGWVPSLTPWGAVVALVISVIVFIAGLAVRRLRAHEPTWITPTGAAIDARLDNALSAILKAGDLGKKPGSTQLVPTSTTGAWRAPAPR